MPDNDFNRLKAVYRYLELDISKEKELQEISDIAAQICNTPIALMTLIDEATQYIKFKNGSSSKSVGNQDAFCSTVIHQGEIIVVQDTALDPRFAGNPLGEGEKNIQFYAGAPITTKDGMNLGSLSVMDHVARSLTEMQTKMLSVLAKQAVQILEYDLSSQIRNAQYLQTKKNENILLSLFESSGSCQMLVGRDFELIFFNKAIYDFTLKHYGYRLVLGEKVIRFISPENMDDFSQTFELALSGQNVTKEYNVRTENKVSWWKFNFQPALNAEGKTIGVSYSATEITDVKTAKAETLEHEQMLRAIAFIQSHEIRRPVASILGLVNLMKLEDELAGKEEIVMLEHAALELDNTIRRIVGYSRAQEQGKM